MELPDDLRYSTDHEWVRTEGELVRVGITDYAQDALGDVVFVELPATGTEVAASDSFSEVESTKSVSEIYAPVAGVIVEVNSELSDAPEKLNEDPYGEGWICVMRPADASALDSLMDADAYRALIDGE
ncbi:MAG: glycine cleavage system protein GcvH [Actinomycetota bacterium]